MTCVENHMVIGNDDCVEAGAVHEEIMRAAISLNAAVILRSSEVAQWARDDVMEGVFNYTGDALDPELHDFWDCLQEVLEMAPESKLAKLIKYQAEQVAARAIDINKGLK